MYSWFWRKLPFGLVGKLISTGALLGATLALLWYIVFPWATPLLPFDDVQVGTGADTTQGDANENPNTVASTAPDPADSAPINLPGTDSTTAPAPGSSDDGGGVLPGN